jgi:tripartite-type tricarboxylate transporter receptor subunit TctC
MKKILAAVAFAAASLGAAAAYPDKAVTLVVPFPPGGSTDAIARVLAPKLQESLGQPFVIENKPGATGTLGAAFVKNAPADGYTLLVSSLGPFVIAPHLIKDVKYDAMTDFDPIMIAVQAANVLVVPNSSPDKNVADLLAHLKKNPGKVTFASSGNGSSDHLSAELLWQITGSQGLHVPYKGGGPAIADVLAGKVDAAFVNINSILPHVKAGKVRPLGISSSWRSPLLPDVPTLQEQGFKGAEVQSWQAVAGPKGLPPDVKAKLHKALVAALKAPDVKDKLLAQGFEIVADEPDHFAIVRLFENMRWKHLIEARNIKAE